MAAAHIRHAVMAGAHLPDMAGQMSRAGPAASLRTRSDETLAGLGGRKFALPRLFPLLHHLRIAARDDDGLRTPQLASGLLPPHPAMLPYGLKVVWFALSLSGTHTTRSRRHQARKQEREREKEREVLMQQKTQRVLACIKSEGLTLDRLWIELLNAKDSHTTALVTRVLNAHGTAIADAMAARRPKVFEGWVKGRVGRVYGGEAKKLRGRLKEGQKKAVKAAVGHLAQWKVLEEMGRCAPVLLEAVEALRGTEEGDGVENAKDGPLSSGLGSSKES